MRERGCEGQHSVETCVRGGRERRWEGGHVFVCVRAQHSVETHVSLKSGFSCLKCRDQLIIPSPACCSSSCARDVSSEKSAFGPKNSFKYTACLQRTERAGRRGGGAGVGTGGEMV